MMEQLFYLLPFGSLLLQFLDFFLMLENSPIASKLLIPSSTMMFRLESAFSSFTSCFALLYQKEEINCGLLVACCIWGP